MASARESVAEFQGLYGPFVCPERVLQRIWHQREFALDAASTLDGRPLRVEHQGHWNLLGGPDFKGARLRIGGESVCGDVEVHFHAGDWAAHGHQHDPAYSSVVLHVLLFHPGPGEREARRADGAEPAVLVMLPLLLRDLEEYASDDALEQLTARDEWRRLGELANRPAAELQLMLRERARSRWRQKVRFARLRIERLGWHAAAHHTALEILGYRHNRAPMLAVASRFPLGVWNSDTAEAAFGSTDLSWQTRGVRPANHPLARLGQYAAWHASRPDWPDRLTEIARGFPEGDGGGDTSGRAQRRALAIMDWRARIGRDLTGGAVGGSRLDNLVCDGLLPLASAASGRDLFSTWFNWHLGDAPDGIRRALPRLGVAGTPEQPVCHGYAQGLLSWLIENENVASS